MKDEDGNNIELVTNASGETPSVKIATGTYYAAEILPSTGYKIDETARAVTVQASNLKSNPALISSVENPITYVYLKKASSITIPAQSASFYSLANAKYWLFDTQAHADAAISAAKAGTTVPATGRVRDEDGQYIELVTNATGETQSVMITPGTYYAAEVVASKGYEIDGTARAVTVQPTNLKSNPALINSVEEPIKVDILVRKSSTTTSVTGGNGLYVLQGTTFKLYPSQNDTRNNTNAVTTLTVQANGVSDTQKVLMGNYYFAETSVGTGYLIPDNLKASSGGVLIVVDTTKTITL